MPNAIIPCEKNLELEVKIEAFAEVIRVEAHKLSGHGLSEKDFYDSGILEGAIQRIRGPEGTFLVLGIRRGEKIFDVKTERRRIEF